MKFVIDTDENFSFFSDPIPKVKEIYVQCQEWASYRDYQDVVDELETLVKDAIDKSKTINELFTNLFRLHSKMQGRGEFEVDKIIFDNRGVCIDGFYFDGNDYSISIIFDYGSYGEIIAYKN